MHPCLRIDNRHIVFAHLAGAHWVVDRICAAPDIRLKRCVRSIMRIKLFVTPAIQGRRSQDILHHPGALLEQHQIARVAEVRRINERRLERVGRA